MKQRYVARNVKSVYCLFTRTLKTTIRVYKTLQNLQQTKLVLLTRANLCWLQTQKRNSKYTEPRPLANAAAFPPQWSLTRRAKRPSSTSTSPTPGKTSSGFPTRRATTKRECTSRRCATISASAAATTASPASSCREEVPTWIAEVSEGKKRLGEGKVTFFSIKWF